MTVMTDNELKKIAGKIAKCLALAASDNPAEAEAAKRQATALMSKYNLTSGDVAASLVHEKTSKAGGKYNPPQYMTQLSAVIAEAFGCGPVFSSGGGFDDSLMYFYRPRHKAGTCRLHIRRTAPSDQQRPHRLCCHVKAL
ncbi:MAG: DUF2786 domain-containing protein [Methylobacter sp.]|uniref:DUF2786 domain-containing protein n=1 Tax=Methylobacter sp. TaxID=2051955 RepID=UPI002730FA29|nr:DUF2786 domain-containing protein [Methylobacter sp.]MDP1664110.1 DUF2786 domain-containing protein [Methylobacter sp.]